MNAGRIVTCRPIDDADLPAVVDCLRRGFPERPRAYWLNGLERLARREPIGAAPRFGHLLECGGAVVGVLLQIVSERGGAEAPLLRCNLSSLAIDPPYRPFLIGLQRRCLALKQATFVNISPAPHTRATIAADGFRPYARGQIVFAPLLSRGAPGAKLIPFAPDAPEAARLGARERRLLADHAEMGCVSYIGVCGERVEPLVFLSRHIFRNRIPCVHVIYARDLAALAPFARAIGRACGGRAPLCVVDADGPHPGLAGRYFAGREPRYARGANPPASTDLAWSELVVFGR